MEFEAKGEEMLRNYLLGNLSEEELQAVEERLMTGREFSDFALVVESMLVEDYVEGRLEGSARANFERLFLATPQGREQVRFAQALKEYASKTETPAVASASPHRSWRAYFSAPGWALAVAAIILIAAGIGVWRIFFLGPGSDEGLIALNKAYQERPVAARITVLDHKPRPTVRGGAGEKVDDASLKRAEIILKEQAREDPGAVSFHELGCFYLAGKDFDRAIDYFKKALELEPNDARILSDLGAAYLERGKAFEKEETGKGAEEFSRSLEHLNRALELDPAILAARFNRALLYQQMSRHAEARDEWQEYLRKDSDSPWADEARNNIEAIKEEK
ncbi:MAG: tetratricopeptide repeat protein [Blastocatellia bacterium]|nr:tetratricopeptide repeat protein [Blastocatellia bacterium]